MKKIKEDIKSNNFERFYLIYGNEGYLIKRTKDALKVALTKSGDTMNYTHFEGKNSDIMEILQTAETVPFFSERRFILVDCCEFFKTNKTNEKIVKSKNKDDLYERLKQIPNTTTILFVEDEIDKRSKLYKFINENGYVSEINTPSEKNLIAWVKKQFKMENKEISDEVIKMLITRVGVNMFSLKMEIDKLLTYALEENEIKVEHLEICSIQIENKIFVMIENIANKNQKKALELYYNLLELKEVPIKILVLITRHFNILLQVKDLVRLQFNKKEISEKIGIPVFAILKYIEQAKGFSADELLKMFEKCVEYDETIKMGKIIDKIAVELLIIEFSSKK